MDDMTTATDTRLYGDSEAGCWMVYSNHGSDRDDGWGPFETRTEVAAWMAQFDRTDMYAVNLTDHPKWWNA